MPSIEIGCVKDFPGVWAEYRVFDGGIQQIVHRISTPEALAWSEQCRVLYRDFGMDYQAYAMGPLNQRCFTIPAPLLEYRRQSDRRRRSRVGGR